MTKSRGPIAHVEQVRFHRNGNAGAGFYVVKFAVREGRARKPMVGIVFAPSDDTWPLTDGRDIHGYVKVRGDSLMTAHYAVIDPADPIYPYRGDDFYPQLAEAVDEWTQNGKAFTERTYVGNGHRAEGVLPADVVDAATGVVA